MEESTTFDEAFIDNEARFPSFTLCPLMLPFDKKNSNKSIESFEDVAEEIENVKTNYKITYYEQLPYEEPKIVDEAYNQSLNNDWYFAPRISDHPPFDTVICLIMVPYRKHQHKQDKRYQVSYLNCEIVLNYINYILVSHSAIIVFYLD